MEPCNLLAKIPVAQHIDTVVRSNYKRTQIIYGAWGPEAPRI
jgi:hypothetical protein